MFPSPMTFRFIEDEGGWGVGRISQTREYIFTWDRVVVCPLTPTPNVLAPLVYKHTVKYFELQTVF